MRAGIANSLTHDIYVKDSDSTTQASERGAEKALPLDIKRLNGIVPQHDINYNEIALIAQASKGVCKDHCEQIFRKYSERAHAGYRVDAQIPHVGRLNISIGVCSVSFNKQIITQSRGVTAVDHMKRHHSANVINNLMNTKLLEK